MQATTLLTLVIVAGIVCVLLASVLERLLGWLIEPKDDETDT